MTKITRRQFLPRAAATAVLPVLTPLSWAADTPEFRLRFGTSSPLDSPVCTYWTDAADAIRKETSGRLSVEIFPNSQLGGDAEMMSQLRAGSMQMQGLSTTILSTLVPVSSIAGLGFAFNNYDQVWAAMDGDLGKVIRDGVSKVGLVAFERIYDTGFRQITTGSRPIQTAQDLSGLKLRVPVTPALVSLFRALGASPTPLNVADAYMAMQTKVVDGQENPLITIQQFKFYEVQKYCAITNHAWDGNWTMVNGRVWASLPQPLQESLRKHFNEQALKERAAIKKRNDALEAELAAGGMVFTRPDLQSFRTTLKSAKFYEEWKQKYGPEAWAALEKYVGPLG